ncbi:MAG: nicotinate (nicotinamide) nucleotide adenylyltransferase [Lachnospiraceae bacterium]|nr:nicotinate (nicotinamide) nucleotide adenylyltransferase [Lachnospiraceae bacterium]
MRIGILGGTFNPPHLGHLKMAEKALHEFSLDEIWFIPAGIPPHKEVYGNAVVNDRVNMVKLLIEDNTRFKLCDIETHKAIRNYTYLTMSFFRKKYPSHDFFYIIGEDSLNDFDTWSHPEVIAKCCSFLVAIRNESDFSHFEDLCIKMGDKYDTTFSPIKMEPIEVSSTSLRNALLDRDSSYYERFLKPEVLNYILDRDLYLNQKENMDIHSIYDSLKESLKPSRYEHTLGVMYTAVSLAMRYNYPLEKAKLAGLLHDCAKNLSDDELILICEENGIEISAYERKAPYLLHAKVGAFFAKTKYSISDEDILHAITVHTTGCPNMSLLDKIIFTADYIEPLRDKAENLSEIRSKAFIDIDEAIVFILRDTLKYLEETGKSIDPMTQMTFDFYKETTDYFDFK